MNLSDAIRERDQAMLVGAVNAENANPGWHRKAYAFLLVYAHQHAVFDPESLTDAAATAGYAPPDKRAWGGIFQRAARKNIIARSWQTYRRRYGHGTEGRMWTSKIYGV